MRRQLCSLTVIALLLASCGGGGGPGSPSGSTAATVGSDDISSTAITDALEVFEKTDAFEQLSQQNGKSEARRLFEQGYLSRLIRRQVLEARAADLGVSVPASDVSEQLDQIKAQFGDEKQFQDALEQQGLTTGLLERFVEDRVLEQKLRTKVAEDEGPPEEKLRAYYADHEEDFQEVRASHILLKAEQAAKAKEQADKLYAQLQSAPDSKVNAMFASLAKKFSADTGSGANGGDLGWADPAGYVDAFAEAIKTLPIGEVSRPVQTEFGYHLIKVSGRRAQPFEAVRDQVATEVSGESPDEAWQDWIVDAYRDAEIEVNPRYGELDLQTQQVVDATAEDVPGAEESPKE